MQTATDDSVLDDAGLFRALQRERILRGSEPVDERRPARRWRIRLLWLVIAAALGAAAFQPWNTL